MGDHGEAGAQKGDETRSAGCGDQRGPEQHAGEPEATSQARTRLGTGAQTGGLAEASQARLLQEGGRRKGGGSKEEISRELMKPPDLCVRTTVSKLNTEL